MRNFENHTIMKPESDLNLEARKYIDTVIRLAVFALLTFLC